MLGLAGLGDGRGKGRDCLVPQHRDIPTQRLPAAGPDSVSIGIGTHLSTSRAWLGLPLLCRFRVAVGPWETCIEHGR